MGTSATQVAEVRNEIARSRRQLFETAEAFEQRLGERKRRSSIGSARRGCGSARPPECGGVWTR